MLWVLMISLVLAMLAGSYWPLAGSTVQSRKISRSNIMSLSKSLDRNNGVLKLPLTGDGGIETTVPNSRSGTTLVIPPPDAPGES